MNELNRGEKLIVHEVHEGKIVSHILQKKVK